VELYTYAGAELAENVVQTMQSFGITSHVRKITENLSFSYFHPLSPALLFPGKPAQNKPLRVTGDIALRFGFVEGDAIITANYAVYDPQGGPPLEKFEKNGSKARHLAYVLNENEISALTQKSSLTEAVGVLLRGSTEVVIVKKGPQGATVFQKNSRAKNVPAYQSQSVFKVGSGDVFSAIFALEWAENKLSAVEAADAASRAVAYYVETRSLSEPPKGDAENRKPLKLSKAARKIYLAGPFFDIAKRWLIEESLDALEKMGADVFSPYHDVGYGPPNVVARQDLKGLDDCGVVLALIDGGDPGTLFEIGYAIKKKIPVVAFGENVSQTDLTMLVGSGCEFVDDFASAIYRTIWKSFQQ
jgi:hypothetical protein